MTVSNFAHAERKLSDRRRWIDQRREDGYWVAFYQAVKSGDIPMPVVEPIKKRA